jgi:hypothetical protein
MPIDTSLLTRVDKLTKREFPFFDDDEWIKMYGMRDAIHDFHIQTKSQRKKEQSLEQREEEDELLREGRELEEGEEDPDVVAVEDRDSGVATSEMETHNGEFWWGIFDYMVPSFRIWDAVPGKDRRLLDYKNPKDRRKLFMVMGNQLLPFLSDRAGGTPTTDNKKPDGSQVTFPGRSPVGDTPSTEEVPSTGT